MSDGTLTASDSFVLTVTGGGAPTYLFTENFEGPGFQNTGWSLSGAANPDYTTTPLEGLQSLNTNGAQYAWRKFAYATSFNMYFQVRWNTWSDFKSVITWDNSSWGEAAGVWAGVNQLYIKHGSVSANGTTVLAPNTTYHVWVEWTKGGGTNGTMKLYVSTTGTKPAAPEATHYDRQGQGPDGTLKRTFVADPFDVVAQYGAEAPDGVRLLVMGAVGHGGAG